MKNKKLEESVPFDFEEVERSMCEATKDLGPGDRGLLADALAQILRFVVGKAYEKLSDREMIARRAVALAWVVDPGLFEAKPSLTKLAQRLGLHKVLLSKYAAEVTRRFGIQNTRQADHYPHAPNATN